MFHKVVKLSGRLKPSTSEDYFKIRQCYSSKIRKRVEEQLFVSDKTSMAL